MSLTSPLGERKHYELENLACVREWVWDAFVSARSLARASHRDSGRLCPTDHARVVRLSESLADIIRELDRVVPRDVDPYLPRHRTAVDPEHADVRLAENKECV